MLVLDYDTTLHLHIRKVNTKVQLDDSFRLITDDMAQWLRRRAYSICSVEGLEAGRFSRGFGV